MRTGLDQLDSVDASPSAGRSAHRKSKPRQRRPPPPRRLQGLGPLSNVRCKLPVTRHRVELLEALRQPVSIIEGDTGSGKTTQVPQFILEEAAKAGRPVRIACTQPRRLSALAVAERIAAERGEPLGKGGAVGYAVRGAAQQDMSNSLLVCTVGVLLRILEESDPTLSRHASSDEARTHCELTRPCITYNA
jgi:ATP-dependent RNA helicase DHX57